MYIRFGQHFLQFLGTLNYQHNIVDKSKMVRVSTIYIHVFSRPIHISEDVIRNCYKELKRNGVAVASFDWY